MTRLLPALLLLLALPAQAEIYKWVDEAGRTHFGEEPPVKYRQSASPVVTQPLNTIDGKALGKRPGGSPTGTPAESAAPAPAAPAPASGTGEDRCAREHERYAASQACFARYRNANGSLKAEAAAQCENVPQPTCDLPR